VATDCAARGGSTGLHSGLRTGRIAGLLCRPWAGRLEHGCHVVGAVPGRQRREEIAAVGRARCGPADPPMSGVRAGARTATQVKFAPRAVGRGSRAGRRTGPSQRGVSLSSSPGRVPCQSGRRWGTDTRARGRDPCQSGRRWGTDGPVASTSRRSRARGPGPGDSDHATAGAAGRAPRTAGASLPAGTGDPDYAPSGAAGRARGRPGPDCIRARHV
jgi:hypothetical protein